MAKTSATRKSARKPAKTDRRLKDLQPKGGVKDPKGGKAPQRCRTCSD